MLSGGMCVATMVTCGNGALDSGEQCDDRNAIDGDGCSSSCQLEDNVLTEQCSSTRTPLQISLNQTIRLRGTTSGATSDTNSCNGANRALGPDVVFELRLREAGRVRTTVTPGSRWDIILKGSTMCPGECVDLADAGSPEGPVMTTRTLAAGTMFYLIVDGYASGDAGDFTLETSLVP
jgi:cysteine-rich repeat protein